MNIIWIQINFLIWFDSLQPSQQFFSYVGTGLPELNQYLTRINVVCSRTKHSDAGEVQTRRIQIKF